MNREIARVPVWALDYLLSGDESGLSPEQKSTIDSMGIEMTIPLEPVIGPGARYFSEIPLFGEASTVMESIVVFNN